MANYLDVAKTWLTNSYDVETQREVLEMIKGGPKKLEDAFSARWSSVRAALEAYSVQEPTG